MNSYIKKSLLSIAVAALFFSCGTEKAQEEIKSVTAAEILGKSTYRAISYGGYRKQSRAFQPTIEELKEDMKLLAAMDIKLLRTYNTKLAQAKNILKAISELKKEDSSFEMYVMLGAWIDCEGAWTASPNHDKESEANNAAEIERAVAMAKAYPDIVKIIAVGNEAMVKWAASYYVQPDVILKWVNHLQDLKSTGELSKELWITSSDNFASWGGGGTEYHVEDLTKLMQAVDYISMHTYPMHDTHYNPDFWKVLESDTILSDSAQIERAMERALVYAQAQYDSTKQYMKKVGVDKPIHIGETGWASFSNGYYGPEGSKACDEYKEGIYYKKMRNWTEASNISCFYFEAFDEPWKDANNTGGSENHFGLFTVDGQAKFAIWDWVDDGAFKGLARGGNEITKTFDGDKTKLWETVEQPPVK